jgi:hypothetical protein
VKGCEHCQGINQGMTCPTCVDALRAKLERTVGYWNDTRQERGEYMMRAEQMEALARRLAGALEEMLDAEGKPGSVRINRQEAQLNARAALREAREAGVLEPTPPSTLSPR